MQCGSLPSSTGIASFSGRQQCVKPSVGRVHLSRKHQRVVAFATATKRRSASGQRVVHDPLFITVNADGSDSWRLDPIIAMIADGKVGIIPTDSLPAIVCDLENRDAVLKMYAIKNLNPRKQLSILCRGQADISNYTTGFPTPKSAGQPNWFNVMRRLLPGPYTIILPASRNLPNQCVDELKGKTIARKSVGVRLPADPVCQAILRGCSYPLLCTSVHVPEVLCAVDGPEQDCLEVPDAGSMLELYGNSGIDFLVDVGVRITTYSTVVDMTGAEPEVIRVGKGDPSPFQSE